MHWRRWVKFDRLCATSYENLVRNFHTEFHENPTDGLLANTGLRTEGRAGGRACSPRETFLYSSYKKCNNWLMRRVKDSRGRTKSILIIEFIMYLLRVRRYKGVFASTEYFSSVLNFHVSVPQGRCQPVPVHPSLMFSLVNLKVNIHGLFCGWNNTDLWCGDLSVRVICDVMPCCLVCTTHEADGSSQTLVPIFQITKR